MPQYPSMDIEVDDLRICTLSSQDAPLLVAATHDETAPALWGPHPPGPYSMADAEAALRAWSTDQVSFGVLRNTVLVAAIGLMPDGPDSAELAYWVRPDSRRQRIGLRGVRAVTDWAHRDAGVRRVWLEIRPGNEPSKGLAERAGYAYLERRPDHCRDRRTGRWHDCLIWTHEA